MLPEFKPAIETTPSIRPHRIKLNVIWIGDATYSIEDAETMVRDTMLAIAEQRRRAWVLLDNSRLLRESASCPL